MKAITAMLVYFVVFYSLSVNAGEVVTRTIESDLPMIIDGNWIYPENGDYTIVMTDSLLTVNRIEYYRPKDRNIYTYEPPSREKGFMDWIIRTTSEQAHQIVDSGGSPEEAKSYMDSVFTYYADGDTFRVSFNKHGHFVLFHGDSRVPTWVPVPKHPRREEPKPSPYWMRESVEVIFNLLCKDLEKGFLIFRRTDKNAGRAFRPSKVELVIKELKAVPEKAVKITEGGKSRYRPMIIADRYKLTPKEVELLVNPKRLKRR